MHKVTLTAGTRIGVNNGEKIDGWLTKYDWFVVGEGDGECLLGMEFTVVAKHGPHATMNGGGFDYTLECPAGIRCTVRTTLQRNDAATFVQA